MAVYISQEEWGHQDPSKRTFSRDMVQESYETVDSLGKTSFLRLITAIFLIRILSLGYLSLRLEFYETFYVKFPALGSVTHLPLDLDGGYTAIYYTIPLIVVMKNLI